MNSVISTMLSMSIIISISSSIKNNTLYIEPAVKSSYKTEVTYKVDVYKSGLTGISKNSQRGVKLLLPGKTNALSSLFFAYDKSDLYKISVSIFSGKDKLGQLHKTIP